MNAIIELILAYAVILFSVIFYNLCYKKLTNNKIILNFKNVLIIVITSILILLNNLYENLYLKAILTSIIFCISFKILYKDNLKKIIIIYVIIYTAIIIIEIFLTNFLLSLGFLGNYTEYLLNPIAKFILSVTISLIEYCIFSIKIVKKMTKKLIYFFENNINTINIAFLLIATFTIIGMVNINSFATSGSLKLVLMLFLLFLVLFAIIIQSRAHEEILKNSNQKLIDYNEKYGKFLDEYKIYKHNIKHKLAGMKAFGNKKINALIDDLLEEETTFTVKNNNIYNVPKEIKGIVAERLYNAKIDVIVDNKLKDNPFKNMNAKEFNNISESIGICLDNAVEASLETTNPIVTLDLYEDKEYVYIKTGNNFSNTIDIDELGDKYYSTKNRGSGLGLFSLKQNKFIQEKISIINDFYYIELKIKKHADN